MVQQTNDPSAGRDRPVQQFRMTALRRLGDASMSQLVRLGVVPHTYLLTTRGRKTGKQRTNPVTIVERDGHPWLVAPYGPVSWVLNARAAGRVTLSRRGHTVDYVVREVPPVEAGPVLKEYLAMTKPTRRYFTATPQSPVQEFVAEAGRHPVFALTPAG